MRFATPAYHVSTYLLAVLIFASGVPAQSESPPSYAAYLRAEALLTQLDKILVKLEVDIEEIEIKMLLQPDNAVFRSVFDGMTQRQTQLLAQRESLIDLLIDIKGAQGDDAAD